MRRAALALACELAACRAGGAWQRETPRWWLEAETGVLSALDIALELESDGEAEGEYLYGEGLGATAGFDFAKGALDHGLELGFFVSQNGFESDDPLGTDQRTPAAEILRGLVGLRSTWDPIGEPLSLYARGGLYAQHESFDAPELVDRGSWGWYAGVGVDWRFERCGRLGPFVLYHCEADRGLGAWLFGVAVRFHLGRE